MALDDYELSMQTQIVGWKCSRNLDCNMKFIRRPRHIKLEMRGLLWSIEALALQNPKQYSFIITHLKRSEPAPPNLPAKLELLLAGYKESMTTMRRVEEALDKLYAFSNLFSLAEGNRRWEIVLDAEITRRACESAKAAVQEAAKAAAAVLIEGVSSSHGGGQIVSCERSGWWIDEWTVEDELWAKSFFPRDIWECMMRQFQAKAVQNGNVVQWCTVQVFDEPSPNFQFEIAVPEFLDGDDVLLRIGLANDRALTVRVFLTVSVNVVCSQVGLEPGTSLGLGYLLPEVVRQYVKSALRENEGYRILSGENVVEGLIGHLTRYLAFLGNICVICGFDRFSDVPRSSTCSNICKATKLRYEDTIARFLPGLESSEEGRLKRREKYVKKMFKNTWEGRTSLTNVVCRVVVDEGEEKRRNDGSLCYEKAVGRVAKMKSESIQLALGIPESNLWIDDAQSFQNSTFSPDSS